MKKSKKLASGYRLIFGYLGIFLILVGIICLLPLLTYIFYPEEVNTIWSFLIPGVSSVAGGLVLYFLLIFKREKMQLGKFQDSALLVLIWVVAILIGSVPFMLRGMGTGDFVNAHLSFTEAVFESTSGYATVGITVFFTHSSTLGAHVYSIYRALLQLFGGVGLILIVTSVASDRHALRLYTAEGHNDKLMPNLAKSARLILAIYLGYIVVGTAALTFIGGLSPYDAFIHSTTALSTGGFSSHPAGIIGLTQGVTTPNFAGIMPNEIAVNIISCVLMCLGATNFLLHLMLFKGKIKQIIKDCEIRFAGLLVLIFVPLMTVSILLNTQPGSDHSFLNAFGNGTFIFFSTMTTTGFSSVANVLADAGQISIYVMIILMIIGGGMGSTAGGIKQYRMIITSKMLYWSIRDKLNYKGTIYPHYVYRLGDEHHVTKSEAFEAFGYSLLYMAVVFAGTMVVLLFGKGFIGGAEALFEFASALSGTGFSIGISDGSLMTAGGALKDVANMVGLQWTITAGMFAGRLEILAIYFAFFRMVRDIFRKETV